MPTYATATDFTTYSEGAVIDDAVGTDRLLERAERDIDSCLIGPLLTSGLKYDPTLTDSTAAGYLTSAQKQLLMRATVAQAEYRLAKGEDFFIHAQYDRVSGPDFTTEGRLPYIGPKAVREIAATGLWRGPISSVRIRSLYPLT